MIGVSMSKFSAMIPTELHMSSLMSQVGAPTNWLTMGGKLDMTEQSTPVKPKTDMHNHVVTHYDRLYL